MEKIDLSKSDVLTNNGCPAPFDTPFHTRKSERHTDVGEHTGCNPTSQVSSVCALTRPALAVVIAMNFASGVVLAHPTVEQQIGRMFAIQAEKQKARATSYCEKAGPVLIRQSKQSGHSIAVSVREQLNDSEKLLWLGSACGAFYGDKAVQNRDRSGDDVKLSYAFYDLLSSNEHAPHDMSVFLDIALAASTIDLEQAERRLAEWDDLQANEIIAQHSSLARHFLNQKQTIVGRRDVTDLLGSRIPISLHETFDPTIAFTIGGKRYTHADALNAYSALIAANQKRGRSPMLGSWTAFGDDAGMTHYFAVDPNENTFRSFVVEQALVESALSDSTGEALQAIPAIKFGMQHSPTNSYSQFPLAIASPSPNAGAFLTR